MNFKCLTLSPVLSRIGLCLVVIGHQAIDVTILYHSVPHFVFQKVSSWASTNRWNGYDLVKDVSCSCVHHIWLHNLHSIFLSKFGSVSSTDKLSTSFVNFFGRSHGQVTQGIPSLRVDPGCEFLTSVETSHISGWLYQSTRLTQNTSSWCTEHVVLFQATLDGCFLRVLLSFARLTRMTLLGLWNGWSYPVVLGCFLKSLCLLGSQFAEVYILSTTLCLKLQWGVVVNLHHRFNSGHRFVIVVSWKSMLELNRIFNFDGLVLASILGSFI